MADDKCRRCWESTEIIEQITEAVSPNNYWVYQRYNNVTKIVYQQLIKGMQLYTLIVPYNRYQLTEILEHKSLNYNGERNLKRSMNRDQLPRHILLQEKKGIWSYWYNSATK
jgi:hypothetical protein